MKRVHTHYDNLKVTRNAPNEVIRAAYKSLSQKYHPDRNPNNTEASRIMTMINEAYEVLSDVEKRKSHDIWIKEQENKEDIDLSYSSNEINSHVIKAGCCRFNDLPEDIQHKIVNRIKHGSSDQLVIKLNGVFWSYFLVIILSFWFIYLFDEASKYKWSSDTNYWYIGVTVFSAILIAKCIDWIYLWHTSSIHSFLIVTPVYVIRTYFDTLWFWPIWTITDLKATHNYQNGIYQGTSLSIYFEGKLEKFCISRESTYHLLFNFIKDSESKIRAAVSKNDTNYLIDNDDFIGYHHPSLKTHNNKNKTRVFICLIIFFLSLMSYGIAYDINNKHPDLLPHTFSQTFAPTYSRSLLAPNGEAWPLKSGYIKGFQILNNDGLSTVTIDNTQNDSDVFVKLVSIDGENSYPIRTIMIHAHDHFTLNKIRAGNYDVRYRDLDSGILSRTDSFNLQEVFMYDGTQYSNITMTLYKVGNGNMQVYGISESEF